MSLKLASRHPLAPPISGVLLQQAHITVWSQRAKGLKMTHTCTDMFCYIEEGPLTEMHTLNT